MILKFKFWKCSCAEKFHFQNFQFKIISKLSLMQFAECKIENLTWCSRTTWVFHTTMVENLWFSHSSKIWVQENNRLVIFIIVKD